MTALPFNRLNLSRFTVFSAAVWFFLAPASAAELSIANHSFENPVLSDGVFVPSVPGWISDGTTIVSNPSNDFFSNTADGSPQNPLHETNAAAVNVGGSLTYQDTNWVIQPDSVYRLTFLAGYRIDVPFGDSSVSLWAGTNLLAETFPTPVQDTFAPFSLSYTSPPAGPIIGTQLRIELRASGADSQAWFDNFHLFLDPSVCTPHKATAAAQLVNGVFVGAMITNPGCGYTNAPPVIVQGGGGSGAAATAVVTNGRVVAVRVDNGGCCYTNAPEIIIGSPPFIPTVEVRFSKVAVVQNIVLGRKYVLESSFDLVAWNPTGPSFTATSERIETEFDINLTGRYFRLREAP